MDVNGLGSAIAAAPAAFQVWAARSNAGAWYVSATQARPMESLFRQLHERRSFAWFMDSTWLFRRSRFEEMQKERAREFLLRNGRRPSWQLNTSIMPTIAAWLVATRRTP